MDDAGATEGEDELMAAEASARDAAPTEGSKPEVVIVRDPPKARRSLVLLAIVGVVGVGAGVWFVTHRGLESTDDAQIDGDMVSVPARVGGAVVKVAFGENQLVKAGDVLAEIDPEPARAKLAQTEAALEAAKANADAADADARVAETNAKANKNVATASLRGASVGATATEKQIAEGEAQLATATATAEQANTELERTRALIATQAISKAAADLAETQARTATAQLELARARLAELKASVAQAKSRVEEASARAEQVSDVDVFVNQARARARVAHAQIGTAQAARDLAALDLGYTKILAPEEGIVSKKSVALGQMLQPGQAIVTLVPTHAPWVVGNFKETQVAKMRVGQSAHVTIDAYPGVTLHGQVESFSAATGAKFALLPPDNASGNYTKVVQRLPVRIKLVDPPEGVALRPGMSVDLVVDTRSP